MWKESWWIDVRPAIIEIALICTVINANQKDDDDILSADTPLITGKGNWYIWVPVYVHI